MHILVIGGTNFAAAFAVGSFFASALALGGVMTAMWLGHWYLVTPALRKAAALCHDTCIDRYTCAISVYFYWWAEHVSQSQSSNVMTPTVSATSTTAISAATPAPNSQVKPSNALVVAPLSIDVIGWLRLIVAFVLPLALLGFILKLIHDRSFQSATGMLYLVVVLTLAGEALSRGLFLAGLS